MNKKRKTSVNGVKKKLMGAVCMLLVASIMMISATYAWFTLSTAPEVTGITTSVGANGSLEMALLNGTSTGTGETDTYANLGKIQSKVGDSSAATNDVTRSNITWGNLVDLSDTSYGTNAFKLNPAALVLSENNKVNQTTPLATPTYGTDGRVNKLDTNTVFGTYSTANNAFLAGDNHGVRGIGVAAAMTEEQLAMRNAIAQVAIQTAAAKALVQNALNSQGSALASLAAGFATNTAYEPSEADVAAVNAVVEAVNAAKADLLVAIQNAMLAEELSKNATASRDLSHYTTETPSSIEAITKAVEAYKAIGEDVAKVTGTDATAVKTALKNILDTDHLTLNGTPIANVNTKDAIQQLINDVLAGKGLTLVMTAENAGALNKIAVMTGNIAATVHVNNLKYGDLEVTQATATMTTAVTGTAKMVAVGGAIADLKAATQTGEAAGTVTTPITDLYGYAIDLAFRTNASGSYLKLQTEAAQRIYADGIDQTTQGSGSYMEFTPANGLTVEQFGKLVSAIKVLFVDDKGSVVAVAGADVGTDNANIQKTADGKPTTSKLNLVMKGDTITGSDGKTTVTTTVENATKDKIMGLDQGKATKLTVMVYLDGNTVQNGDVSATELSSLTGTMNLQFASSADLVPMDYTPLHNRKNEGADTQP